MEDEEFRRFVVQTNTKLDDILDKLSAVPQLRTDIMARIDRLQDALTLGREEQVVDQATILLLRRQIAHLQDRVQALEERAP